MTAAFLGHPARTIVNYAENQGADLIVLGAQGEGSPLEHLILGGTAERVVRLSHVPVLTVPRKDPRG